MVPPRWYILSSPELNPILRSNRLTTLPPFEPPSNDWYREHHEKRDQCNDCFIHSSTECCLKDLDLARRAAWCLKLGVTVISTLSSGILNLLDLYIFNSFIYLVVPLAGHALSVAWARWWRCGRTPKFGQPAIEPLTCAILF